jgi:hypothetical protein
MINVHFRSVSASTDYVTRGGGKKTTLRNAYLPIFIKEDACSTMMVHGKHVQIGGAATGGAEQRGR